MIPSTSSVLSTDAVNKEPQVNPPMTDKKLVMQFDVTASPMLGQPPVPLSVLVRKLFVQVLGSAIHSEHESGLIQDLVLDLQNWVYQKSSDYGVYYSMIDSRFVMEADRLTCTVVAPWFIDDQSITEIESLIIYLVTGRNEQLYEAVLKKHKQTSLINKRQPVTADTAPLGHVIPEFVLHQKLKAHVTGVQNFDVIGPWLLICRHVNTKQAVELPLADETRETFKTSIAVLNTWYKNVSATKSFRDLPLSLQVIPQKDNPRPTSQTSNQPPSQEHVKQYGGWKAFGEVVTVVDTFVSGLSELPLQEDQRYQRARQNIIVKKLQSLHQLFHAWFSQLENKKRLREVYRKEAAKQVFYLIDCVKLIKYLVQLNQWKLDQCTSIQKQDLSCKTWRKAQRMIHLLETADQFLSGSLLGFMMETCHDHCSDKHLFSAWKALLGDSMYKGFGLGKK